MVREFGGELAQRIVAMQFSGDDRREHLALDARERRFAHHDRDVKGDAVAHGFRVQRHDVDDVPDSAGSLERGIKLRFERAGGLGEGDLFDPGHRYFLSGMCKGSLEYSPDSKKRSIIPTARAHQTPPEELPIGRSLRGRACGRGYENTPSRLQLSRAARSVLERRRSNFGTEIAGCGN